MFHYFVLNKNSSCSDIFGSVNFDNKIDIKLNARSTLFKYLPNFRNKLIVDEANKFWLHFKPIVRRFNKPFNKLKNRLHETIIVANGK